MDYGVTENGFVAKSTEIIKTELETLFKEAFGDDIDVSDQSNFGVLIGLLTKREITMWELAEAVYSVRNPDDAEGINLDKALQFIGLKRLPAIKSTVNAVLIGDENAIIETGQITAKRGSNEEFILNENVTLSKSNSFLVRIAVNDVQSSTIYSISINGTVYSYTTDSSPNAEEIISELSDLINAGSEPVAFIDNEDGTGQISTTNTVYTFSYDNPSGNIDLTEVGCRELYIAAEAGATYVGYGELTEIVTPSSGLNSVFNYEISATGRDRESDADFKARKEFNLVTSVGGTDIAIKNNLLSNTPLVSKAIVKSNRMKVTDPDGRPPASVECVVIGGTDEDVAQSIYDSAPAGIETYGNTTVIVKDSQENEVTIKFSRPETKYLWVRATLTINSDYPSTGDNGVESNLLSFIETNQDIGKDVKIQTLYKPVYDVEGIDDAVLEIAITDSIEDTPVYQTTNIDISFRQIAIANNTTINVSTI